METIFRPTNQEIAEALEALALRLEEREANEFRIKAYLQAADSVRAWPEPLPDLVERDGPDALRALSGVGERLASRIAGYLQTGRLQLLESLNEQHVPEWLLKRISGIGDEMARRLVDELGVQTLEDLELAVHDGRLAAMEGFGPGRVRAIGAQLDQLMRRRARRRMRQRAPRQGEMFAGMDVPPAALVLAVDRAYRRRAERGELFRITPRRFNPDQEAWLPVMRLWREGWHFTAMFSNTARAHELGKTDDWVVLYFGRDAEEGQCTVVTESRGDLKGLRVIRGREAECRRFYDSFRAKAA